MEFSLTKEELMSPLQKVMGVVDKKQLQAVLSFVLLNFNDNELIVTATDLDLELSAKNETIPQSSIGKLLLPGRKLLDICKSLPDKSIIKFKQEDNNKVSLIVNRSRFTLSSLEPDDFPIKQNSDSGFSFSIAKNLLRNLIGYTSFAIAQQDVRHYLMGMLWEFKKHTFNAVSTDGHRLAKASYIDSKIFPNHPLSVIVPRKSVLELQRLLDDEDGDISVQITTNTITIDADSFNFSTKLIDSKFPDYNRVFPEREGAFNVFIERDLLRDVLTRVSILSNEKHKAVRLCFSENQLVIAANNQEHEQAEEVLEIAYNNEPLEICINYSYLIDVLQRITTPKVMFYLRKSNTPVLLTEFVEHESSESDDESDTQKSQSLIDRPEFIIMPMCL